MALEDEVHPLATTEGQPIPFNIARPHGLMIVAITDVASITKILNDATLPHIFLSSIDCIVTFNGTPDRTSVAYQADTFYVPAGKEVAIDPIHADFKAQAFTAGQTGSLFVQAFEAYQALGRKALTDQQL